MSDKVRCHYCDCCEVLQVWGICGCCEMWRLLFGEGVPADCQLDACDDLVRNQHEAAA